jgi:hypothetical protein
VTRQRCFACGQRPATGERYGDLCPTCLAQRALQVQAAEAARALIKLDARLAMAPHDLAVYAEREALRDYRSGLLRDLWGCRGLRVAVQPAVIAMPVRNAA